MRRRAYRVEGTFERDLVVRDRVRLTVRNPQGAVRVRRGEPGRVHVVGHVTIRAPSRKRAEAWLQRMMAEPPITRTDGDVRIEGPTWAPRSRFIRYASGSVNVIIRGSEVGGIIPGPKGDGQGGGPT